MAFVDWLIVVVILILMITSVWFSKRYMQSVADFLAAGRTAGRYIISLSQGIAGLGAITIIGMLEMNYIAGFAQIWWGFTTGLVILIITVSGWVIYRFRQTRALTLAQFFEIRYSRNFRVFTGLIAFLSGIINFGIFPAVGARFFIYFCGLPQSIDIGGWSLPLFPLIMLVLLSVSLYFVFAGGQIAVIVADFFQGVFVNSVFIVIMLYLLLQFDWMHILTALQQAPQNASLINPFKTSHVDDFNFWYFLIGVIGLIYNKMSWQGTQAYNTSAKSAHEAKMGEVLGNWRNLPQQTFLLFIPVIAYTVMHHSDFAAISHSVDSALAGINGEAVQSQLRVPLVLRQLLPPGIMGLFTAVLLAAFISTHDTYLHSWGSILVQDVLLPLRKKPIEPQQHIRWLRTAIIGVALFIFLFSLLFQQSQYIFLFFAVTGAIFAGGSGAVIIGGLYWKRGTTAAAWSAMITGSAISVGGIIIHQVQPGFFINGQEFWALAMGASALVYILVSLTGGKSAVDLDKLLHRGKYVIREETHIIEEQPKRRLQWLGMGKEFTRGDKIIYFVTYSWTFVWLLVFIIGTVYNLSADVKDSNWQQFWKTYLWIHIAVSTVVVIWFTLGGISNLREMMNRLKSMKRNVTDNGRV